MYSCTRALQARYRTAIGATQINDLTWEERMHVTPTMQVKWLLTILTGRHTGRG